MISEFDVSLIKDLENIGYSVSYSMGKWITAYPKDSENYLMSLYFFKENGFMAKPKPIPSDIQFDQEKLEEFYSDIDNSARAGNMIRTLAQSIIEN